MNIALNMFLLQFKVGDFRLPQKGTDYAIFFLLGVGVVILFLLLINFLKNSNKVEALNKTTTGDHEKRKFSIFTFRRIASNLGLDKEQTNMLEFVMKCDEVTDLARSLESPELLDRHFKKAYRII